MRREGSVTLLAVMACAAMALVGACLVAVVTAAHLAFRDEVDGRARLATIDVMLAGSSREARTDWRPRETGAGDGLVGVLVAVPDGGSSLLRAVVQDEVTDAVVGTAMVEQGLDGLMLPSAALVAGSLSVTGIRPPAVGVGTGAEAAEAWLQTPPPAGALADMVAVMGLPTPWTLDEGTLVLAEEAAADSTAVIVRPEAGTGEAAHLGTLLGTGPAGRGRGPEQPVLVVWAGDLDASGLGELWAVLVTSGPIVRLDGTMLHGAVFTPGEVDFGSEGGLVWEPGVLQWGTDRAIMRTRLLPGTRGDVPPTAGAAP